MKRLAFTLFALCIVLQVWAYEFSAVNNGKAIYYNITSLSTPYTAEVTSGSTMYSDTVSIPDSVSYKNITYAITSIGDYAFYECTGLACITIPSSVKSIGNTTFGGCTGLTSLTIPSSVTTIKSGAFFGCTGLTSIYAQSAIPVDLYHVSYVFFGEDYKNCILHVPVGSKSLYAVADQWEEFFHILDESTVVHTTTISGQKAYMHNGMLELSGLQQGETIRVYSMQGIQVFSAKVNANKQCLQLPIKGVYIVSLGNENIKILNF